jgi:hypothetical protein
MVRLRANRYALGNRRFEPDLEQDGWHADDWDMLARDAAPGATQYP